MNCSSIRTEEVPTEHGETVEVEVVDCCSCKQTVPVERTALAVVMDETKTNLHVTTTITLNGDHQVRVTKKDDSVNTVEVTRSSGLNDAG